MEPSPDLLALTLTYKAHSGADPVWQFKTTKEDLSSLLNSCATDWKMYPELTTDGNLHYHGILAIRDKVKWYKKVLPTFKRNGFVKLKKVFDLDEWIAYCRKDLKLMKKILEYRQIPLTHARYLKQIQKTKALKKTVRNHPLDTSPSVSPGLLSLLTRSGEEVDIIDV